VWLAFLVAAGVGAPARFLLDSYIQQRTAAAFPWGTLVVNVSGCLILGILTGLSLYHGMSNQTRLVLGTGGMGAYTTFSTFSFETVRLAEEGALDLAVRNAAANLFVGLAAAAAGIALMAAV